MASFNKAKRLNTLAQKYKVADHKRLSNDQLVSELANKCQRLKVDELVDIIHAQYNKKQMCEMLHSSLSLKEMRKDRTHQKSKKESRKEDVFDRENMSLDAMAVANDIVMFVDDRIEDFNDYVEAKFEKKQKVVFVKKLGKGKQGVVNRMSCGKKVVFAQKVAEPVRPFAIPTHIRKIEETFLLRNAFNNEYIVELAAAKLLGECIFQKICPNFSLMYGAELSNGIIYQDMELIKGRRMREWISRRSRTIQQWNSVVFQILVALWCMQKHFGMIHDDLHTENVMISELENKDTCLYYQIAGKKYYVPTYGYFVQLIDFGRVYTPKNKLNIKWHLEGRKKDRPVKSDPFLFDYRWLTKNALADAKRREAYDDENDSGSRAFYMWCIRSLQDAYRKKMSIEDIIATKFTSNQKHGKDVDAPNFDLKPKVGSKAQLTDLFNLDQKLDTSELPKSLRSFVKT